MNKLKYSNVYMEGRNGTIIFYNKDNEIITAFPENCLSENEIEIFGVGYDAGYTDGKHKVTKEYNDIIIPMCKRMQINTSMEELD